MCFIQNHIVPPFAYNSRFYKYYMHYRRNIELSEKRNPQKRLPLRVPFMDELVQNHI